MLPTIKEIITDRIDAIRLFFKIKIRLREKNICLKLVNSNLFGKKTGGKVKT